MWNGWKIPAVAALLVISIPMWAQGPHTSPASSTDTGLWGEFNDLEIDLPRSRLYVSDESFLNEEGVVVVDLETHQEVARIPMWNPTGLELSPSGDKLAVGSGDGVLRLYNADTLEPIGSAYLREDQWTSAVLSDLAFDGEDRLAVTLNTGPYRVTCCLPFLVVNLVTMLEESRVDEAPWGTSPGSSLYVDQSTRLLYVLESGTVRVYDMTSSPPSKVREQGNPNFAPRGALSADGQRLYFPSGRVYDAATLGLLGDTGHTGDVSLDDQTGYVHYYSSFYVDRVDSNTYEEEGRYWFGGSFPWTGYQVHTIAVDPQREVGYAISGSTWNGRELHAIPFVNGFVDPWPSDGSVLEYDVFGISVVRTGNIEQSNLSMYINGALVPFSFDAAYSTVYHTPSAPPFAEGVYRVEVVGWSATEGTVRMEWQFAVDFSPPIILLDEPAPVYRVAQANVTGQISDTTLRRAQVNGENLTVDASTGAFRLPVSLLEGGNRFSVEAEDGLKRVTRASVTLLYIPPTRRYVDLDGEFSIDYPGHWTLRTNESTEGTKVEAIFEAAEASEIRPNLNVIAAGEPPSYSDEALTEAAEEAVRGLSSLPGFVLADSIRPVTIEGMAAVSYAYVWRSGDVDLFQRQYLVANESARQGWILTFTCRWEDLGRYDPLFKWLALTLRAEPASETTTLYVALVASLIAGLLAGIGVAGWFLWTKRRREARPPPGTPGEAEGIAVEEARPPAAEGESPETLPGVPGPPPPPA